MARLPDLALPTDPIPVQVANKAGWNEKRDAASADFFTLGYMRRGINEVVHALLSVGVSTLIDVRRYPVSMYKPEFSKENLRRCLADHGIGYWHVPTLGVPRDVRGKAIGKANRDDIWSWYDQHVVARFVGRNLTRFFGLADHPVAFMCMELDPTACHRHRLALALERCGLRGFDL